MMKLQKVSALDALAYFALLTFVPIVGQVLFRVTAHLAGKRNLSQVNASKPWEDNLGSLYERLHRVHSNCLENLLIYGTLIFVAYAKDRMAVMDETASLVLTARVAQMIVHASGTTMPQVMLRFTCYLPQVVVFVLSGLVLTGQLDSFPAAFVELLHKL